MTRLHNGVTVRWQQEIQKPRNLKQWWQQWIILTCLDSQKPRVALNMQFPGMTRINKLMGVEMMMMKNHEDEFE